ncbi:DUF1902 domain-containing protein, partial [Brevundimonas nasdae]|uniref:DUF1902 domain-containing protein n=1 Tax=Brevundimonas nasdae TaxID=172043 RepID=UPI00289EDBCD
WDPAAGVWCSESNIIGLVLEADNLGEFETLMRQFAPEILAENLGVRGSVPIRFEAIGGLHVLAA